VQATAACTTRGAGAGLQVRRPTTITASSTQREVHHLQQDAPAACELVITHQCRLPTCCAVCSPCDMYTY
jgi:hypothetical protein